MKSYAAKVVCGSIVCGPIVCGPIVCCLIAALAAGCYNGAEAARDVNKAWRGHARAEIEGRWGTPAKVTSAGAVTRLQWSHSRRHFDLPSAEAELTIDERGLDARAELRPGRSWESKTIVTADVDASGTILAVDGPSLRWGAPRAANLRWGLLFGAHVGMGRLDDTSTMLPGGGLYIGGMLSSTVGLVGCFALSSGSDDEGGAMGFAWGLAGQWWVSTRTWLRAGPAMVLAFDPGFADAGLEPGVTGGASYALIRSGAFVLDLRADLTAGTSVTFATVGVGVNIN